MDRPLKRRGFLLVLCLLLTVLLFVLGLGFLGKRSAQYQRVNQAELAAQAKALAEAGLEDVLVKVDRDLSFPPMSDDQQAFSYSEEITQGGGRIGGYTVTIDGTYRKAPYWLLRVTVLGEAGPDLAKPEARRTLTAEIDVSHRERLDYGGDGDLFQANPYFRQLINFNDLGGL